MKRNYGTVAVTAAFLVAAGFIFVMSRPKTSEAAAPPAPRSVEVSAVEQRDLPIQREWTGALDGLVDADVKAQVTGYLLRQDYQEGSFVRKEQWLFEIDPRPFQAVVGRATGQLAQTRARLAEAKASLVQAQAQLQTAEANQRRAQLHEDRYIPLVKQQAVT